jgi:hypothetical protein
MRYAVQLDNVRVNVEGRDMTTETPTKVLFLDIDGVLNSARSCYARGGFPHDFSEDGFKKFDHIAIDLIQRLCEKTGAKIVLSSTWRILHTVLECADGLSLPIFDRTKMLNGPRGKEIKEWLDRHPEVTKYAIVDDDSDMLPEQKPFFVQTSFNDGLSMGNFTALKNLLLDEEPSPIWIPDAPAELEKSVPQA